MKPLIVLMVSFGLATLVLFLINHTWQFALAGRIAMAIMLLFTSVAHFAFNKGMAMMLPPVIPSRQLIVYVTGVLEIILAIGLLIPSLQVAAGWITILFFIVLLPANIYAASNYVNYEKASRDGKGPAYLWLRVPMQVLFIAWMYFSAIYAG